LDPLQFELADQLIQMSILSQNQVFFGLHDHIIGNRLAPISVRLDAETDFMTQCIVQPGLPLCEFPHHIYHTILEWLSSFPGMLGIELVDLLLCEVT